MKFNLRTCIVLAFFLLPPSLALSARLNGAVNALQLGMGDGTPPSTIWIPTATVTINTTSDTSVFSATGQGPGQTITPSVGPPAAPYIGNTFSFYNTGVFSTPAVNTVGIITKIKWGSVTVASGTSSGLQASATNLQYTISGWCQVITISASVGASTVMCSGQFTYAQALTGSGVVTTSFQSLTPVAVDTTAAFKPDITMAWSAAITTQTASSLMGIVQIGF